VAATEAGAQLTEAHRLAQIRLSAQTVARLLDVWPLLDVENLDATSRRWVTAALSVVQQQRTASERLALAYFTRFRAVEVPDAAPFTPPLPAPLPASEATTSLLARGPYRLKSLMAQAVPLATAADSASAASASAGARHVLNGGRQALVAAADADPEARGHRRVTASGCCAFCALLSARSYDGLSSKFFEAHDNCSCSSEVMYPDGDRIVERQAREFAALYAKAQDTADGTGSNPALYAFRRALTEQREGA
jgi:hypothetical protein